jgi:hypothetical protein
MIFKSLLYLAGAYLSTAERKVGDVIPGSFIVMLKEDLGSLELEHFHQIMSTANIALSVFGFGGEGGVVGMKRLNSMKAYSAMLDPTMLKWTMEREEVALVEEDRVIGADTIQIQNQARWGLCRISQ